MARLDRGYGDREQPILASALTPAAITSSGMSVQDGREIWKCGDMSHKISAEMLSTHSISKTMLRESLYEPHMGHEI